MCTSINESFALMQKSLPGYSNCFSFKALGLRSAAYIEPDQAFWTDLARLPSFIASSRC